MSGYKSKSQRLRVLRLHQEGKISTEKLKEYEKKSDVSKLPDKVEKKPKPVDPNKWAKWPKE